ncbi:MAG: prepilin peptidase [Pseudomonadota bacterium]
MEDTKTALIILKAPSEVDMPLALYLFFLGQLLVVSYLDFRYRKISNWWLLVNLIFFIVLVIFLPQYYPLHWAMVVHAMGILAAGFGLYVLKIMGAGDVKYLFGLFLVIPQNFQQEALIKLLGATVLIAVPLILIKVGPKYKKLYWSLISKNWRQVHLLLKGKNSFAPVILFSWIWLGWEKWELLYK